MTMKLAHREKAPPLDGPGRVRAADRPHAAGADGPGSGTRQAQRCSQKPRRAPGNNQWKLSKDTGELGNTLNPEGPRVFVEHATPDREQNTHSFPAPITSGDLTRSQKGNLAKLRRIETNGVFPDHS